MKENLNKWNPAYITLFLLLFIFPFGAGAQQKQPALDQLLFLPAGSVRLDSFSRQLSSQSGLVFSFNANKVNPGKKIRFPNREEHLNDLLLFLYEKYGLSNKIIGNHIILSYSAAPHKEVVPSSEKVKKTRAGKVFVDAGRKSATEWIKRSGHPQPPSLPPIDNSLSFIPSRIRPPGRVGNIFFKQGNSIQTKPMEAIPMLHEKPTGPPGIQGNPGTPKELQNASGGNEADRFHILAGVTGSEVQYINPQIKAGFSWFFLSAEWRTNFKVAGFFYGLGVSRDISRDWGLQLSATSGVQSSRPDTSIRVKSRLTAINFLAEKHFKKRWTLQFGPVLNFMKSEYAVSDVSIPVNVNLSKRYYNLRPPYTISSNYNKRTNSGKKLWVGLQIGLFYRLW